MPKKTQPDFEQRQRALALEEARYTQMQNTFARLPDRSTPEIKALRKAAEQAHATLKVYDLQADPPLVSEKTDEWFVAALTRLNDIVDASNGASE